MTVSTREVMPLSIKINIHPNLFGYTNDQAVTEVSGHTVGECLKDLETQFPGIEEGLFDKKKGRLFSIYDIWINGESAYPEELAKKVQDGDEIYITTVIGDG